MPDLPDDEKLRVMFDNRLPESCERKAMEFIREFTAPLSDAEFFALRAYWRKAQHFFDEHFAQYPEARSAHEFIVAMLSATNHRAYAIAPTPDSPHPTVNDLIAENEALKARIAELEAEVESPYQVEAPKNPIAYTTPAPDIPPARFILRGKVVVDNPRDDWRESEEKARQLARELAEKMKREWDERADRIDDLCKRADIRGIVNGDNKTPFSMDAYQRQTKSVIGDLYHQIDTLNHQLERVTAESSSHLQKAINGDWLTFAEYQHRARETAVYKTSIFEGLNLTDDESRLARLLKLTYTVMGLAGEVGEFANIVKKIERDGKFIDDVLNDLVDELGDVVWYVFACADELGVPLEDVARHNLAKLTKRKEQKAIHDNENR